LPAFYIYSIQLLIAEIYAIDLPIETFLNHQIEIGRNQNLKTTLRRFLKCFLEIFTGDPSIILIRIGNSTTDLNPVVIGRNF
jgi:hypothetical protein